MARHRHSSTWPTFWTVLGLALALTAIAVALLHQLLLAAPDRTDTGLRPVPPTPAITYTGPITTGPTPTPAPDPGGSP